MSTVGVQIAERVADHGPKIKDGMIVINVMLSFSKTEDRGTVCGKAARTGLWGCGEVTNRSTRMSS